MQRRTRRIVLGVALIAALAAGGAAFTASNTFPNGAPETGFGATSVSGATVDSVAFTQTTDRSGITGATLKIAGDITSNHTVEAGFGAEGSNTMYACSVGSLASGDTTVTCDFTAAPLTGGSAVATGVPTDSTAASNFDVSVNAT